MRSRSTHQMSQVTSIEQHVKKSELRPDLWDERYTDKEREKLMVVAQQYGLDPMTKEVMVLRGNIYVTASGLQKLALQDPEYDGCEIELVEIDWANNFFVVKARIWKKNCSHPFEDYGDADPTTSNLRGHALFRHAITRARARAMRSAFAIPFCSLEELDDETRWRNSQGNNGGGSTKRPKNWKGREETPKATATDAATEQQHAMLARYCKELKLQENELVSLLDELFHIDTPERLTRSQCSQLLDELSQRKAAAKAEAQAEAEAKAQAEVVEEKPKPKAKKAKAKKQEAVKQEAPKQEASKQEAKKQTTPEPEEQTASSKETSPEEVVEEPKVEEPKAARPKPKTKSQPRTTSTLPRWTVEEQKRIADDLVQRMQEAKTMKELRREWELFQGVRHQLSEEWFAQICETKEQRKAALAA